ncbi:MliC family protein [Aliiglaciecola sp. SL4]|uniref:MliC family protein n=1 Tax=Aliiglaciecola sp. SL4 TaxID=3239806 RepID=UPI00355B00C4
MLITRLLSSTAFFHATAFIRWTLKGSIALCLGALTGCGATSNEANATAVYDVAFTCMNGESLRVRFYTDQETAVLVRHSDEITLSQRKSASGFIYSNGPNTIRGKGDNLTVEIGRMMPIQCVKQPL